MPSPDLQGRSAVGKRWTWPSEIADYLQKWILEFRSPAFLVTDEEGRVTESGGELSRYGLGDLQEGESAAAKAYFLEGLLPLDTPAIVLSRLEISAGCFADIHLFRVQQGDCVLLLDSSEEVEQQAQIEQALRQTQEHLRQAEKMEAMGRLAGGIAHDFNNLLTVILGYGQMLTDAQLDHDSRSAALEIKRAAERAAAMTRHLLSFSRRQARRVDVIDVNALIADLLPLLSRLIGEDIMLSASLDPSIPFVEADRGQMEQVLFNLAANARDAMPHGGPVDIRTGTVEVDDAYVSSHSVTQLRRGPHVSISVVDSGCGMDSETMARAFEPFFTSKESGQGTGLGLAIVYGIVSQSSGEVFLTSEVGKGTRVEILLPAVAKTLSTPKEVAETPIARGNGTVLVVEDEDSVRKLVREILTKLGYAVLECAEPFAALNLCSTYRGNIDLLVTDFIMPRMNGRELAERVVAMHPHTRVLYMSGYAKESFAKRGMDIPGSVFLPKPFTPAILADRVREALGRAANTAAM